MTRAALRRLVAGRVRARFALDLDAFTERLAALATEVTGAPERLELDDLYLAAACADGDNEAWRELRDRHVPFLRQFAGRLLRGVAATDLVDRVIADLWERRKMARYQGRSSLRTWLGAVVAHAALNQGKLNRPEQTRDRQRPQAAGARPFESPDPEGAEAARLLGTMTSEALAALPADDRLLLLLYYEQELTLDEIEPILQTSKATLSRRLRRVRELVRERVERRAHGLYGTSTDRLRDGVDLRRIEIDVEALLAGAVKGAVKGSDGGAV
jgi:RNA polymerase sigma-70 factor (ECF subfamily)